MITLTNNTRKTYASLSAAKGRKATGLFMAQGPKCVADTLDHFNVEALMGTAAWFDANPAMAELPRAVEVKMSDLERISTLNSVPEVIAVYHIPGAVNPVIRARLVLALDCVQDPGNLGTIIRVADWMGVDTILASEDTADVWNPKVVQATMGAISRVRVHYTSLPRLLENLHETEIYGTFLDGENIYECQLASTGVIVMGNEGKGISDPVARLVGRRLLIPPYPPGAATSESLNVATATAITLAEFRRRQFNSY